MTRDLLDEIKTKWNIPVTLPMSVPWGKDDVVWLVQEVERLRAENERLREALTDIREWSKRDDVIRFDDGDIPLADYCARALHRSKV